MRKFGQDVTNVWHYGARHKDVKQWKVDSSLIHELKQMMDRIKIL